MAAAQTVPPTEREATQRRAAAGMRRAIDRLVATSAPLEVLAEVADRMEEVADLLDDFPRGRRYVGFAESANSGDAGGHFDFSPILGVAQPIAPPLETEVHDGLVVGRVAFGAAYEGPPGCVHGGLIAASFDELLGMAQSLGGQPGMTGTLTVRYRRPTPLHTPLRFEAQLDRVEGRKIFTSGRCLNGDVVTAEAEAIFVSVDFSRLAALAEAREAPTPET